MANDAYTITGQAEVLDVSDVTNPVKAQRITYKSKATGVVGTVDIPLAELTPEKVHELVSARVANSDAIHEL